MRDHCHELNSLFNMKTYAICPVSTDTIDENLARLNGGFTFLTLVIFWFTQSTIPVAFLLADFILRATGNGKYSPITLMSRTVLSVLPLHEKTINAGPKLFAARLGAFFALLITTFLLTGFTQTAVVISGVLGFFSFLESAFNFCVACEIYPFLYKFLYKDK